MRKLIVFGATGGTGKQVVKQALQAGYQVTAIVRNPSGFKRQHPHLTVVEGNVLQPLGYNQALAGAHAVISCLGTHQRGPTTVYSEGVGTIARAMKETGVTRLLCLSAIAVEIPPRSSWLIRFVTRHILQRIFRYMYADMVRMEALLRESELNWTVIRPPRLTNGKERDSYRTTINEPIRNPSKISRADLAHYIVNHITDEKTVSARIEISY